MKGDWRVSEGRLMEEEGYEGRMNGWLGRLAVSRII